MFSGQPPRCWKFRSTVIDYLARLGRCVGQCTEHAASQILRSNLLNLSFCMCKGSLASGEEDDQLL